MGTFDLFVGHPVVSATACSAKANCIPWMGIPDVLVWKCQNKHEGGEEREQNVLLLKPLLASV